MPNTLFCSGLVTSKDVETVTLLTGHGFGWSFNQFGQTEETRSKGLQLSNGWHVVELTVHS